MVVFAVVLLLIIAAVVHVFDVVNVSIVVASLLQGRWYGNIKAP